jgi:hypothetical protein
MIGCGPIFGRYSTYSFCPFRFMIDAIFYAAIISPLFFLIRHRIIKKKEQEK